MATFTMDNGKLQIAIATRVLHVQIASMIQWGDKSLGTCDKPSLVSRMDSTMVTLTMGNGKLRIAMATHVLCTFTCIKDGLYNDSIDHG